MLIQFRCFRSLRQAAHDSFDATEPSIAGVTVSETPYTVKDRINYQDGLVRVFYSSRIVAWSVQALKIWWLLCGGPPRVLTFKQSAFVPQAMYKYCVLLSKHSDFSLNLIINGT